VELHLLVKSNDRVLQIVAIELTAVSREDFQQARSPPQDALPDRAQRHAQ